MMGPMDMGLGGPTVFPSSATRLLSAIIHFVGASICAFCFARRLEAGDGADLYSLRGLAHVPWARWCAILVFITSWIFEVFTGVLIHGVGLSMSDRNCDLGIIACIAFYVASKFFIYLFLTERVYIVWNAGSSLKRWQSPIFCVCAIIVGLYGAVIVLMSVFRIAERHPETNSCVIGLQGTASAALLTYDLFINVWLTGLFLWPLARATLTNSRLRRVATRTLTAASVALTTSTANIVILAIFNGKEPGWICLASCGADVTVNALVLFWVTGSHESAHDSAVGGLRTINGLTSARFNSKAHAFDLENGAFADKLAAIPTRSHSVWRLRSPSLESWEAAGAAAAAADNGPPASIYSTLTDVLPAPTRPASMTPSVVDRESAVQCHRGAGKHARDSEYGCESDDSDMDADSAELEFATTQSAEHAHHAERELEQKRCRDALGAVTKAHGRRDRQCNCAVPAINGKRQACGGSAPSLTEMQVLEPVALSQRTIPAADVVRSVATEPQSPPGSHSPPRAGTLSQALASFARGTKRIRTVVASSSKASTSKDSSPTSSHTRSGSTMSPMQFAEPQESEDAIPPLQEQLPPARVRAPASTTFGTFPPRNQRRIPLRLSMASKRTTTTLAETDEVELGRLSNDELEDGLWSYAPSLTPTHARSLTMNDLRERPPSIKSNQSAMPPDPYATPAASPGFVADSPTRPLMKPSPDFPLSPSIVSSAQHQSAEPSHPRT